jgi:hypothetical protein
VGKPLHPERERERERDDIEASPKHVEVCRELVLAKFNSSARRRSLGLASVHDRVLRDRRAVELRVQAHNRAVCHEAPRNENTPRRDSDAAPDPDFSGARNFFGCTGHFRRVRLECLHRFLYAPREVTAEVDREIKPHLTIDERISADGDGLGADRRGRK